jgi:acetyl-CoA decarbonylase/synthase complex subunit gamma
MGLTGIEIFKKLPRTNCKDCGQPTCLAFAMKLAAGQAELSQCPHVSEEAKAELSEASAPPIRTVTIGAGDEVFKTGGEVVIFRHEKTFFNPTGIAVLIKDTEDDAAADAKLKNLQELAYERVGLILKADLAALANDSGDPAKFKALAEKAKAAGVKKLILISDNADAVSAALDAVGDLNPLVYGATSDNFEALGNLAKEKKVPLGIKGKDIDDAIAISEKLTGMGLNDLVIDTGARKLKEVMQDQVAMRRAALEKLFRPLGFPSIAFPCEMANSIYKEGYISSVLIPKYTGIIILSDLTPEVLFPLLLQRLNIYTDPQRPMMTDEKVYAIGNPDENSPLYVTCNFSLTYFVVSGEIEGTRVPSWLLVVDTEGLSVLTAWAAGKFSGDLIGIKMKKLGVTDKVKHNKVIIPGAVAVVSGELEEELGPDWEVLIGPREAAAIPAYIKTVFPQ